MDAAAVSRAFKRSGKTIEQRVLQALNTLVRYAGTPPLPNGTFAARCAQDRITLSRRERA